MYPHHVFDLEPAGTFGMYPICYQRVSGRYFQPEPAIYSRCFCWFPGPLTPSVTDAVNFVTVSSSPAIVLWQDWRVFCWRPDKASRSTIQFFRRQMSSKRWSIWSCAQWAMGLNPGQNMSRICLD